MSKFVTLGEIMLRMTRPEHFRIAQGNMWHGYFGGSEANVAVSLASMGNDVEYVTRLPNNLVGRACRDELRRYNVGTHHIIYGGDRLGLYYYEEAASLRSSSIVYDREDSSMKTIDPREVDWAQVLNGTSIFHWSGITSALSPQAAEVTKRGIMAAVSRGFSVSFDINYRKNLWHYGKTAQEVLRPLARYCDIIFGTDDEWELLTGIPAPRFTLTSADERINAVQYKAWCEQLQRACPDCRHIVVALRNVLSANHHILTGILFAEGKLHISRVYDIDPVLDPMGVGDAFIAAYLHAVRAFPTDHQRSLDFALAASAIKNTIPGDFNLVTADEVENLAGGNTNGRVQR